MGAMLVGIYIGGFVVTVAAVEGRWINKLSTAAIWPAWMARCLLLP